MPDDLSLITQAHIERMESVRVAPDPPDDFEAFWRRTLAELEKVPLNLEIKPVEPPAGASALGQAAAVGEAARANAGAAADLEFAVWHADSFGGRRIGGLLARPRSGVSGVWVYGHGYGSIGGGVGWRLDVARMGFVTLGYDVRGYNRSRLPDDPRVPGWILAGIEDKERYILRGAVMDAVRAVQVARALAGADSIPTVLYGQSFSGGLGVMAAPWIPDLTYLVAGVPTFGAYDLRRRLVRSGSGAEINALMDKLGERQARALRDRLRYFDAVNFAPHVVTPEVTVGYGVVDPVVPRETVVAIYHAIGAQRKELLRHPCSHLDHPLTAKWRDFERHVLERARSLVR